MTRTETPTSDRPVSDDRSLSITSFCEAEGFSKPQYFRLKRQGLAPEEFRIGGLIRITPEARAAWHERMRALQSTRAARLAEDRRREQARKAGRRSVDKRRRDNDDLLEAAAAASLRRTSQRRGR